MKKTLAIVLTVALALCCMGVTAFAVDDNETVITANVPAKEVTYDMVIPADGAELTEENHTAVVVGFGENTTAGVANVANDTASTFINLTVTLADFTDASGNIMAATYTYNQGDGDAELTDATAVAVFDGSKEGDAKYAPATIKVSVDDGVWNAAPAGDYEATIVFNFALAEPV